MTDDRPPLQPHDYWQTIEPAGTYCLFPAQGFARDYAVGLPDGGEMCLPIRSLPDGQSGLASLIINQASFEVADRLAGALADRVRPFRPDVIVGLPTLGLTLAAATAQKLGHARFVPLGTSRKFWYDESLSVPLTSVTSPGQQKRLYIDPRMQPLVAGQRVLLIDDVISTGTSMLAGLDLLRRLGVEPVAIGAAMLQTRRWVARLADFHSQGVVGVFETPLLRKTDQDTWLPVETQS